MGSGKRIKIDLVHESDDPEVNAVFDRVSARQPLGNLHRTMANSPKLLAAYVAMAQALRWETTIDPLDRELAILCVLERHGGEYELPMHQIYGKKLGLTEAQVENVRNPDPPPGVYDQRQIQILRFAARFAADPAEAGELPEADLEGVLDNRQRIELGVSLLMYMGLAHFTNTFDVPHEGEDVKAGILKVR